MEFILKLKNSEAYLKTIINGEYFNTWNIEHAKKFSNDELQDLNINLDEYEIIQYNK
jgi:hypothetical protein